MSGSHLSVADLDSIEDKAVRNLIAILLVKSQTWWAKQFKLKAVFLMTAATLYHNYHTIQGLQQLRVIDLGRIAELEAELAQRQTLH